jgi:type II secretory ATPase GspE/PulE/Tfp pilus assembly ATPase PilB-like protein
MHKSKEDAQKAAVDKTVTALIEKALARGASDIHIEPRERNIVVRFRVDGWLQEAAKLPLPALSVIVRNLKKRAELDTDAHNAPQNGSFQFDSDQLPTTVRLATMPTVTGEKISLHLTRHLSEPATLESLGFWGDALARIENAVAEPHGLVVAASLDHTGASLSLLGVVHLLNNPALNIATLEDPIEHQVAGINQTQVNTAAGVSFSAGLQAVLKQDPNVVMVSDLQAADTVGVAVQAALNGRLIIGGLHVSDAAHGVAHLLNMHVEPFLVASSLRLALGQRFVRRLCAHCREAYAPDESVRKDLRSLLRASGVKSVKELHVLERAAAEAGLGNELPLATNDKTITRLWRANPDGCPHCQFTGFTGRLGICEVLAASETMKKRMAGNVGAGDLRKLAIDEGMIPLPLDGLVKALRGLTTLEEILPLALSS